MTQIRNCFNPGDSKDYAIKEFSKTRQEYDFTYEGRELKVVPGDVVNFYDEIQSYKDETGLANILKMVQRTGDMSLLNAKQPVYGEMPDIGDELDVNKIQADVNEQLSKTAESLGIDKTRMLAMTQEELDKLINDKVNAVLAAQQASASKNEASKEGE